MNRRSWELAAYLPCFLLTALLGLLAVAGVWGEEAPQPPGLAPEQIVERIVELRRELEALMAVLPPELKAEVERRLAESPLGPRVEPPATEPSPVESTAGAEPAADSARLPIPSAEPTAGAGPPPAVEGPEPERSGRAAAAEGSERPGSCDTLAFLDFNRDGEVSGADRYWRYLRLWVDDGDDRIQELELETPYDAGIRLLDVRLRRYTTAEGLAGGIWLEEGIELELVGSRGEIRGRAELAIDAEGLARGGEYRLLDGEGTPLTGLIPLRRGVQVEAAAGAQPLRCPAKTQSP